MAIYKCSVCGAIFDEEKEGKSLNELEGCPVCKQPISKFVKVSDDNQQKVTESFEGELAYDSRYARTDNTVRYMAEIHEMAVTGKSIGGSMGTQMPLPSWDDILILGAQLDTLPLNDNDPVDTRTIIGNSRFGYG
ncbi:MAG: hypothetical protein Q4F06_05650 [Eubacteriales bacterium]|nr:hypothetical protein [Eubacteriales bacterium]